jgi:hypothetical protein
MTSQTRVSDLWDKYYTLTWSTEGVTPLDLLSKGAAILIIFRFFWSFLSWGDRILNGNVL